MLTTNWTTHLDGRKVTYTPTGNVVSYCGNRCQEFDVYTDCGTHGSYSPTLFASVRATRAEVEAQHLGYADGRDHHSQ